MQKMWVEKVEIIKYPAIATHQGGLELKRSPNKVALLQFNLGPSFLFDHLKQGEA